MKIAETLRETFTFVDNRARDYCLTFQRSQPANVNVLFDLARFCRANESTYHKDPYEAARLDGRREVWLRINQHLHLPPELLMQLFAGNVAAVYKPDDGEKT